MEAIESSTRGEDGKVIYESVKLTDCVKAAMGVEATEGYACPKCEKPVTALK